ncbi:MAG: retropepsin-like aspartic protease family protein [Methyloligella sp. ZOD6]
MSSGVKHLIGQALTWACGAFAIFLGIYFFDDIANMATRGQYGLMREFALETTEPDSDAVTPNGVVRIQPDRYGHYSTDAVINGHILPVLVDTGASLVVLTYEDAQRIGLFPQNLQFSGRAKTANGVATVAPVRLNRVRVGGILLHDIPAVVAERGVLHQNLLGMSFLRQLKRFQIENRQLVLTR